MRQEALRMESLCQTIAGEQALNNLTLNVFNGESLAILGANSAETGALLQILSGNLQLESGKIFVERRPVRMQSPLACRALGIRAISEKNSILDNLTIAENIFLGRETHFFDSRRRLAHEAYPYMEAVGLGKLSPDLPAACLRPMQKALAELAAALAARPAVLLFHKLSLFSDSASLSLLQSAFAGFKRYQTAIVCIAQNVEHACQLGDRLAMLHRGRCLGVFEKPFYHSKKFNALLRSLSPAYRAVPSAADGDSVFAARSLSGTHFENFSFSLQPGELTGLCYADEACKNELFAVLSGRQAPRNGQILLHGQALCLSSPAEAIARGIAYAPSESVFDGIFANMSLKENLTLSALKRLSTLHWIHPRLETYYVHALAQLARCPNAVLHAHADPADKGLRRKILIARAVSCNPQVILLDDPLKGLDADAKEELQEIIAALTERGISILMTSMYLKELEALCNRVIFINPPAAAALVTAETGEKGGMFDDSNDHCG